MKTIGEILKNARLLKKITLEEVEKQTKIRKKFLIAFEENDFSKLPEFIFSRGFLKNYSEFLDLSPGPLIAVFRRQSKEEKAEFLPKAAAKDTNELPIKITPKITAVFVSTLLIGIFVFYLLLQLLSFIGKPGLKIYSPKNNLIVKTEIIEIKGKTDPEGKLFINGQEITIMAAGSFSEKINLNKGENKIIIVAKNKAGKENKKEIGVNYK